ncbi:MAG: hypothetical protein ABFQ65_02545 [Nanoarchaeota archaeon]
MDDLTSEDILYTPQTEKIRNSQQLICQINFVWGFNWAKSEKQKRRYKEFQGEEMHFFIGRVKELICPKGDSCEAGWENNVEMQIKEVIEIIKKEYPFDEDIKEYREFQLKMLRELK